MIQKLYAVCLLVNDFEKSLSFYRETLGLTLKSQEGKYADFKLGETMIAIFQKDEAIGMFSKEHMSSGGGAVYAFEVENIEDECKKLKEKGVMCFEGPKKTPWGQEVAYFKDPDGNIWEVTKV